MAILGLVVQKADTVDGLGARLVERFPHARWSRSVAHNGLPSLARQGLVRLVEHGAERALDRYEATDAGVEQFRDWLRASSAAPPMLRDALLAKLELSEEHDVPGLIAAIREEEERARGVRAASSRLNVEWHLKRLGPSGGAGPTQSTRLGGQGAERGDDRRGDDVGPASQAPAVPAPGARRARGRRSEGLGGGDG